MFLKGRSGRQSAAWPFCTDTFLVWSCVSFLHVLVSCLRREEGPKQNFFLSFLAGTKPKRERVSAKRNPHVGQLGHLPRLRCCSLCKTAGRSKRSQGSFTQAKHHPHCEYTFTPPKLFSLHLVVKQTAKAVLPVALLSRHRKRKTTRQREEFGRTFWHFLRHKICKFMFSFKGKSPLQLKQNIWQ